MHLSVPRQMHLTRLPPAHTLEKKKVTNTRMVRISARSAVVVGDKGPERIVRRAREVGHLS